MSHRFKRPKQFLNQGTPLARLRKHVEQIQTQEQFDAFLEKLRPDIRAAGLPMIESWLKFAPRNLATKANASRAAELAVSEGEYAVEIETGPLFS